MNTVFQGYRAKKVQPLWTTLILQSRQTLKSSSLLWYSSLSSRACHVRVWPRSGSGEANQNNRCHPALYSAVRLSCSCWCEMVLLWRSINDWQWFLTSQIWWFSWTTTCLSKFRGHHSKIWQSLQQYLSYPPQYLAVINLLRSYVTSYIIYCYIISGPLKDASPVSLVPAVVALNCSRNTLTKAFWSSCRHFSLVFEFKIDLLRLC